MKIVLNKCFGGFGITKPVFDELGIKHEIDGHINNRTLGIDSDDSYAYRYDPRLVAAIEKVGVKESSAPLAKLEIVGIPDNINWYIESHAGIETVREYGHSW